MEGETWGSTTVTTSSIAAAEGDALTATIKAGHTRFLLIASLSLLAACAPTTERVKVDQAAMRKEEQLQSELALEGLMADMHRLMRVSYPIRMKAAGLCKDQVKPDTGAFVTTLEDVPKNLRDAAKKLYELGNAPKVLYVAPGSSAERAGLKAGDALNSLDGWLPPGNEGAAKAFLERYKEAVGSGKAFVLGVERAGQRLNLTLTPDRVCGFRVAINDSDALNAFADGKSVFITRGMMRFAADDNDLALVVAHELSHNAMLHMDAMRGNYLLGSILDILIAAKTGADTQGMFGKLAALTFSEDFEAEADYVGLYMMAIAGLPIENAPKFWRRMAAARPEGIRGHFMASHPATPYRFLALDETVKEIGQKRTKGAALEPELKKQAADARATETQAASIASQDALSVVLVGKKLQTMLLVDTLQLRLRFTNQSGKGISAFRGKVRFADASGSKLGSVSVKSETPLAAGETLELTETLYPLVSPAYSTLKDSASGEALRLRFEPEEIEFSGR